MQQNMMGHNIIITETSSNLRTLGRNALSGKWKLAILAYIVFTLCTVVPTTIFDTLFGFSISNPEYGYEAGMDVDTYSQLSNSIPETSPISFVYELLVTGAFTLGITIFFLALFRRQEVKVSDIFLGFEHFGKALGLLLYQSLFIFLWALPGFAVMTIGILISAFAGAGGVVLGVAGFIAAAVMAVIASLKYGQAFYIMADNPEKSIKKCVGESIIMMKGNKRKYFFLTLSFIGWLIISAVPMGVVIGTTSVMVVSDIVSIILLVVAGLFLVPVQVYAFSTTTGFYEILAGHLIKETEPAPIDPEVVPEETKAEEKAEISQVETPQEEKFEPATEEFEEVKEETEGIPVVPHEHKSFTINARDIMEHKEEE